MEPEGDCARADPQNICGVRKVLKRWSYQVESHPQPPDGGKNKQIFAKKVQMSETVGEVKLVLFKVGLCYQIYF